ELTEALTLMQTGKSRMMPVILVGSEFWAGLVDWIKTRLVDDGMISPKDVNLLQVIDEPADVLAAIQKFHAEKSKPAETQQEAERQSGMYL
ncbi:LOG family protein, partial [Herbaspirillum sp. UBA812]